MGKVLAIHQMELKPGVDAREFEKFIIDTFAPLYHQYEPRQVAHLMKGDRGDQAGKYALLIEIDSVEARDDMYPAEGKVSDALDSAVQATAPIFEQLNTFLVAFPVAHYTDYVVMGDPA